MPSGASKGPSTVTVTPGVTSISIQWGEVECEERNGEITGYSVRYSSLTLMETVRNVSRNRTLSIDRLQIRTNYSFKVAAINSHGIGAYSSAVMRNTTVPSSKLL